MILPCDITLRALPKAGEPDKLSLMVINRHKTPALPATLFVKGFTPASGLKWEMNGPSLEALSGTTINNTKADADLFLPDITGDPVSQTGDAINMTLPAHSVTAVILTGVFE